MTKDKIQEKIDYHKNKLDLYEKKLNQIENKKITVIGFKRYDNTK